MTPIVWLTRLLVGAYPQWDGCTPSKKQRIYFANHTSHLDTIVIWTSLPSVLRGITRPVAAKDYWDHGLFRKRIAMKELNVVLIDRHRKEHADPLGPLKQALRDGDSLIIFPEGTRRPQPLPSEFKSGLWRLMREFPDVELDSRVYREPASGHPQGGGHSSPHHLLGAFRRAAGARCNRH